LPMVAFEWFDDVKQHKVLLIFVLEVGYLYLSFLGFFVII
jgi:hypothetical protein